MKNSILEIRNLTKYYGKVLGVKDLSLTLYEGEIFGFIGPNGAGKSTTIKSIMNLINKTNGKILLGSGSTTTITDCYAECNSDISLYNSVSKVISTIYIAGGNKYYYEGGADFSNWTMYNGKPLPNGLTWIGGLVLDNEPFTLGSDYNKRD